MIWGIIFVKNYRNVILKKGYIDNNYNPFEINGIKEVLLIIDDLMNSNNNILICSPSNLDGVLSTSILILALRYLKLNVSHYMYDENKEFDETEFRNHIELMRVDVVFSLDKIITVDSSIKCINVSNKLENIFKSQDYILINPHQDNCSYSFKDLTLPALTYKILQAISRFYNLKSMVKFIDLVFISLFHDNVRVCGENYELLKEGSYFLKNTRNYGLRELININSQNLTINELIMFIDPDFINKNKITNARLIVELLTVSNPLKANQICKYLVKEVNGKMEERLWT